MARTLPDEARPQVGQLMEACKEHLKSSWNILDLSGIFALYIAAFGHFSQNQFLLQQVGAAAILLNAFSVLQLLRPFELTST